MTPRELIKILNDLPDHLRNAPIIFEDDGAELYGIAASRTRIILRRKGDGPVIKTTSIRTYERNTRTGSKPRRSE